MVILLFLHYACHYRAHAVVFHYVTLVAKKLKSCLIVFHILIANILPQDNVTNNAKNRFTLNVLLLS